MSTTQVSIEQNGNIVNLNITSSLVPKFVADLLSTNPLVRLGINGITLFQAQAAYPVPKLYGHVTVLIQGFLTNGYNNVEKVEKIKAIKAVREVTSLGLTEAKTFIETLPKQITIHSTNLDKFMHDMNDFGYDVRVVY